MDNKKLVKEIIDIFQGTDLANMEIEIPDFRLSLSKNTNSKEHSDITIQEGVGGGHAASTIDPSKSAPEIALSPGETVKSPIVGTCFVAPGPDKDPFVKTGDVVEEGQPLCIIEAMKMMNEVCAPYKLKVLKVNCENNKMVEFGEPLFEVEKC